MDNNATGFFMVWNPARGTPRVRHPSRKAATAEAERLAALQPGEEFYVLKSQTVTIAPAPKEPAPVTERVTFAPWPKPPAPSQTCPPPPNPAAPRSPMCFHLWEWP